jgi:hypothetical protein
MPGFAEPDGAGSAAGSGRGLGAGGTGLGVGGTGLGVGGAGFGAGVVTGGSGGGSGTAGLATGGDAPFCCPETAVSPDPDPGGTDGEEV